MLAVDRVSFVPVVIGTFDTLVAIIRLWSKVLTTGVMNHPASFHGPMKRPLAATYHRQKRAWDQFW